MDCQQLLENTRGKAQNLELTIFTFPYWERISFCCFLLHIIYGHLLEATDTDMGQEQWGRNCVQCQPLGVIHKSGLAYVVGKGEAFYSGTGYGVTLAVAYIPQQQPLNVETHYGPSSSRPQRQSAALGFESGPDSGVFCCGRWNSLCMEVPPVTKLLLVSFLREDNDISFSFLYDIKY